MSDHKPGRLGTCPICGEKFTNTDKDVGLYLDLNGLNIHDNTRYGECE